MKAKKPTKEELAAQLARAEAENQVFTAFLKREKLAVKLKPVTVHITHEGKEHVSQTIDVWLLDLHRADGGHVLLRTHDQAGALLHVRGLSGTDFLKLCDEHGTSDRWQRNDWHLAQTRYRTLFIMAANVSTVASRIPAATHEAVLAHAEKEGWTA